MSLTKVGLRDFRCFETADCELGDFNVVIGPNGAGKTSLIEAIFFLGRGRSFRTGRAGSLLRGGAERFQVFGAAEVGPRRVWLGAERDRNGLSFRFDGAPAHSLAPLAQALPVLVIEPHSHRLIEGGPSSRRQFVDWGTFHVEPSFLPYWRRFRRALSQRNALLKDQVAPRLLGAWDREFVEAGVAVDAARRAWVRLLEETLPAVTNRLLPGVSISSEYRSGWARDTELAEALARSVERDRERGNTGTGPHRADLILRWDGVRAEERVSRGQQKLLATALLLAQAQIFRQEKNESCLVLVDDPAAELDGTRLQRLMALLGSLDAQLLITGTQVPPLLANSARAVRRFHVEQGELREML